MNRPHVITTEPTSYDEALQILSDGRPIRRDVRRACIDMLRKAVNRVNAYENMYNKVEELEKQLAKYLIQSLEVDIKHVVSILKERYNLNE